MKYILALVCLLNFGPAWAVLTTPQLDYPGDGDTAVAQTPQMKLKYQPQNYTREFEVANNPSFTNSTVFTSTEYYVFINTPFEFSTTYYWRARVKSTNDSSAWTSTWSFKTSGSLELYYPTATTSSWLVGRYFSSSRTTDSFYLFEFDTSSSFSTGELQQIIIEDTSTSWYVEFVNGDLLFGKTYYWRGRSYTGTDSSSWSEVRSGYTPDSVTLNTPVQGSGYPTNIFLKYAGGGFVNFLVEVDTTDQFQSGELFRDTAASNAPFELTYLKFNTTYYWRVKMFNSRDTTRWSQVWNFTTDKYEGSNIIVYNNPDPEIIVRHPLINNADYFELEYDTANTFSSPHLVQKKAALLQDTLSNLLFGKTYYIRYRAIHKKDTSAWCRVRSVNVVRYPGIYRPAYLGKDVLVHDSIWWDDDYRGVTGYQLQCDTSNAYNSSLLMDTIFTDSAAAATNGYIYENNWLFNQTYYLRVRMWHNSDTSEWSNAITERTFTTIAKPSLVKPYDGPLIPPGTDPLFTWDPIPHVPYYRVQLDTNQNLNSAHGIDTLVPAISLGTWYQRYLLFGTRYYWRVKAIETYDSSEWSDTWSFDVRDKVRQTYPKNKAVNYSPGNTLDWASQSGTEGYILWVSEDSTFQTYLELSDSLNNPFFAYPEAGFYKFSTSYFWKVKVFHALDTGEWSDTWKFTTRALIAPSLVSPTNGATKVLISEKLSWMSYSGAASYRYELATDSLFTQIVHNQAVANTTSFALSLQPSTTYYWHVIGRNSAGSEFGEFSETWSFTTDSGFKAPTLLTPANAAVLKIISTKFTWSGDGGTYTLEVAESPSMVNPTSATTSNELITITSLKYGKNYWWRVRSSNAGYFGPWSEIWTFTLQDPNGLENPENGTLLYPNPSSGSFTIGQSIGLKSLTMVNVLGQEILVQIEQVGESIVVNYSDCTAGIYWVNWTDDQGIHQEKISVISPAK